MAENTAAVSLAMPEDEVLHIDHLSINFGGLKAVDDLSFAIKEKEIYGLIGPNGAGKTTVFNCITQFYKPSTGVVLFRNNKGEVENLVGQKVHNIIRKGLVRTFQNVELINELSIIDNVLIGAHIDFKASGFEQALKLPRARKEEKMIRERAMEVLEFMGIANLADALVGGQPYGIRKKVEMARTLLCNPKLIILDEPAAGLNDVETQQLSENIYHVREKFNCTILLVEHDMRLVMSICDRLCAISFGKFLASGTPSEIQSNDLVQEAYLGEKESKEE
ncbi:MAG: ABC transporter ATP-binding protein [Oscillospiraceae bacterium]|nr:ABC transporter ATP-binding protein [Oscillospiraceae bacterium]